MILSRFNKETVFKIPNIKRADEGGSVPHAVRRHYLVMRDAMVENDRSTVSDRQLRLLRGGFEIPLTVKQCDKLLEKYKDVT